VDPMLVARGLPPIDVLKVAHHGSKTASTPAFLDVVRPAVAIVSAGAGNPYGHPARSTLDRLAGTGARVLRTDTDGSVEIDIGEPGIRVATSGARTASLVGLSGLAGRSIGGPPARTSNPRFTGPGSPAMPVFRLVGLATPPEKPVRTAIRSLVASAFLCAVPSSG
jgi:hypothetical protein